MDNLVKISIGIPVYNAEKHIEKSLTSALNQNFYDYEVLIVDDCGTDQSMKIIDTIKKCHSNGKIIRVISHSENLGVSEARNTIIKNAYGKYLFFLDSDDFIENNTLKYLYTVAEEHQSEATYGSCYICKDGTTSIYKRYDNHAFVLKNEFAFFAYKSSKTTIQSSVWNILLLTSHIRRNNISFPNMDVGEDFFFVDALLETLERVVTTDQLTYHYVIRDDSLSNYQSRDLIDINEVYQSLTRARLLIDYCNASKDKPYYPYKCIYVMKQNVYMVFGIIKHRHQLSKSICNKEICKAMHHPATLFQVLFFKDKKLVNIFLLAFSKLPSWLKLSIASFIGKRKGYIT